MAKSIQAVILQSPHDDSVTLHHTREDAIQCVKDTVEECELHAEDERDIDFNNHTLTYLDVHGDQWIFTITTTELPD